MATPTDVLAAQIEKLREEMHSQRKDDLDQIKEIRDSYESNLDRIENRLSDDLDETRAQVLSSKDAITMELSSLREGIARFQGRTDTIIAVANRLAIMLGGICVTLIVSAGGVIWGASRIAHTVESHSQRIEKVEKSLDYLPKLEKSLDRLQKTLDSQKASGN